MTIHIKLNTIFLTIIKRFFPLDKVESVDVLEILKIDLEQGYKIVLCRVEMKQGCTIDDFVLPSNSEMLCVLQNTGRIFTVLLRGQPPTSLLQKFKHISSKFDANVIWDTPTRMSNGEVVISAIGEQETLEKIASYGKLLGTVTKISCTSSFLEKHDMLSFLTDKQRDVIIEAKRFGYYEYPRKMNADVLSKHLGISKATTVEHLRKAEQRIMDHLLAGY